MASLSHMTRSVVRNSMPVLPQPPRMQLAARTPPAGANSSLVPSVPPRGLPPRFFSVSPRALPVGASDQAPRGPHSRSLPPQFPTQLPPLEGLGDRVKRASGPPPPSLSEQRAKEAKDNPDQAGDSGEFTDNGLQEGKPGEGQESQQAPGQAPRPQSGDNPGESGQGQEGQGQPGQGQGQPGQGQPGQGQPGQGQGQPGQGQGQPGQGQGQPGQGQGQPGQGQGQPGQGQGQPGQGQGQPGQGQGQPGQGQGQPVQGQEGQGQPGQGVGPDRRGQASGDITSQQQYNPNDGAQGAGGVPGQHASGGMKSAGQGTDAQDFLPTATPSVPSYDSLFPKQPRARAPGEQRRTGRGHQSLDRDPPPEPPHISVRGSARGEQRYREMQLVHRGLIDRVAGELKNLFETDRRPRHVGPFRSGRLDMKRYRQSEMRAAQGARRDDKVCTKRLQPMERDVEVVFCLDVSGSMMGANINAAEQALVVLCETLRELKVPFSILTFNARTQIIKGSESEDPQGGALLDQISVNGGTDDHAARRQAAEILSHSEAQQRLMLFLTDGAGNNRRGQRLAVAELEGEMPELTVLGIGIGDGCEAVQESYPHAVVVPQLADLPTVLIESLQGALDER